MGAQQWLSEHDEARAIEMRQYITQFWGENADMLTYTPHDPGHFRRVERNIQRLIPREKWPLLSDTERMVLTWCAWTHDVGMHKGCYQGRYVTPEQIRELHVDESATWVRKNGRKLQLTRGEAQVVSEIIVYHSRKYDLAKCYNRIICDTEYIRARLIASYLRLADAMEVSQGRLEINEFNRFPLFQDLVSEKRDQILFHWVKSFVVAGIAANHTKQVIEVEFQNLSSDTVDNRKFSFLTRYVVNELRDELETVESALDSGGISSFHAVSEKTLDRQAVEGEDEWSKLIPSVINHLQMAYSPNATGIARAALESLRAIVDGNTTKDKEFGGRLFQLNQSLLNQLERRNCHNEVARIRERIEKAQNALGKRANPDEVCKGLRNYIANFEAMFSDSGVQALASHFWKTVETKCKQVSGRYRFLLFGCSESVAGVLAKRNIEHPITLYIAEGRPKTIHGAHNSPVYIDAEAYAARIREKEHHEGIPDDKAANIVIIPDACVATAFGRDDGLHPTKGFSAVLFGSNAVYYGEAGKKSVPPRGAELNISQCVAHTVGHLGMAITAKYFNVPVIVVSAAAKLAKEPQTQWSRQDRGNKWLTTYGRVSYDLTKVYKAKIDWCPREEHVPFCMLSYLVTEMGTVDLCDASDSIRKILERWDTSIDKKLDDANKVVLRASGLGLHKQNKGGPRSRTRDPQR